jgi:AAA15 family ATPase/GTPase
MFNSGKTNPANGPLIFTTHDSSLLDQDLVRRDQVWFVEKDKSNASHLYPLTDFKPRAGEALQKGYLSGRYGALPYTREANR